jgi:hypothetical protein
VPNDRPAFGLHADPLEMDGRERRLKLLGGLETMRQSGASLVTTPTLEGDAPKPDETTAARPETTGTGKYGLRHRDLERVRPPEHPPTAAHSDREGGAAIEHELRSVRLGARDDPGADPFEGRDVLLERAVGSGTGAPPHG